MIATYTASYSQREDEQIFPQSLRATSIGICNFVARLITISAPEVNELKKPYPMMCLMAMLSIAVVNSMFLSFDKTCEELEQSNII